MSPYADRFIAGISGVAFGVLGVVVCIKLGIVSIHTPHDGTDGETESKILSVADQTCDKEYLEQVVNSVRSDDTKPVDRSSESIDSTTQPEQRIAISNDPHSNDTEQELPHEQHKSEIRQWVSNHKEDIKNILSDIMPDNISEQMKDNVFEKSLFLENLENAEDHKADDNWGYEKRQEMVGIITHHPLSADYEVASITCKQLMCEVIGLVYDVDSWTQIHIAVFQNAKNIIPGWPQDGRPSNISYRSDGNTYMYTTYAFTQ